MAETKKKGPTGGEVGEDNLERHPYVLMPGKRHTHDGQAVQPGQTVMLTNDQAMAFKDKFYREGSRPLATPGAIVGPPGDGSGSGAGAVGPTHIRQDVGANTMDLGDTNVGNKMPIAGNAQPAAPSPGSSAANTSAATGSPFSPPPPGDAVLPKAPAATSDKPPAETGTAGGTKK